MDEKLWQYRLNKTTHGQWHKNNLCVQMIQISFQYNLLYTWINYSHDSYDFYQNIYDVIR
jgi:hypothetical protein